MSCTVFENQPRPRHPVTVEEHTPGDEMYFMAESGGMAGGQECVNFRVCQRCGLLYDPGVDVIGENV